MIFFWWILCSCQPHFKFWRWDGSKPAWCPSCTLPGLEFPGKTIGWRFEWWLILCAGEAWVPTHSNCRGWLSGKGVYSFMSLASWNIGYDNTFSQLIQFACENCLSFTHHWFPLCHPKVQPGRHIWNQPIVLFIFPNDLQRATTETNHQSMSGPHWRVGSTTSGSCRGILHQNQYIIWVIFSRKCAVVLICIRFGMLFFL